MIHPNLATMLSVVTTDYPLEPGEAIDFLRFRRSSRSFNAITRRRRAVDQRLRDPARKRVSGAKRDDAALPPRP